MVSIRAVAQGPTGTDAWWAQAGMPNFLSLSFSLSPFLPLSLNGSTPPATWVVAAPSRYRAGTVPLPVAHFRSQKHVTPPAYLHACK